MTASLKITNTMIFYEAASKETFKRALSNLNRITSNAKPKIATIISNSLNNSSTVQSLLSGKLRDDFGLFGNVVDVTIAGIVKHISENIKLQIDKSNKAGSILTISVELLPGDFSRLVSIPGGSIPSRGGPVDWLEWLLTKGTQVVVADYWLYPNAKGFTRSGGSSIMKKIESTTRDPFRVDPNYAGTADDNFITRAIEPYHDDILNIVASELSRSI